MKNRDHIEKLEKLIGQLEALHSEMGALAKKSPNDAVNTFKLKLINKVLETANDVLGQEYLPFSDFTALDADDVPSTSDVTLILAQYIQETERFRSDNVKYHLHEYVYLIDGKPSGIKAAPARTRR
jgi:hypothetical protein